MYKDCVMGWRGLINSFFGWMLTSNQMSLVGQSHLLISWGEMCYISSLPGLFQYYVEGRNGLTSYLWKHPSIFTKMTWSNKASAIPNVHGLTGSEVFLSPQLFGWLQPHSFNVCACFHLLQDSDDEGNDDNDIEEKPSMKKEFSHRSPSPPAEDSEPEMTEEEKEFQLVCAA